MWLQRFVATGLKIYPDEVIAQGPPWRMTLCVRGTDHLDTEDGRVYENRYVIWGRMSWGLLREYEVYEDTQASKALDEYTERRAGTAQDESHGAITATLYEWAGESPAIAGLIDAFYDRVEADDELSRLFPGGVSEEHREHVVAWWCEVFGGPARYTDELGGYEHMLAKHRGPRDHAGAAVAVRDADEPGRRRRGAPGRPRVPLGARGVRRVGHAARDAQLAARRRRRGARPGPALGLGRRAAVQPLADGGAMDQARYLAAREREVDRDQPVQDE